jgi:hypothetical protein
MCHQKETTSAVIWRRRLDGIDNFLSCIRWNPYMHAISGLWPEEQRLLMRTSFLEKGFAAALFGSTSWKQRIGITSYYPTEGCMHLATGDGGGARNVVCLYIETLSPSVLRSPNTLGVRSTTRVCKVYYPWANDGVPGRLYQSAHRI